MFDQFKKAKDLFALQSKAKKMKKELKKVQVEAEADGVLVIVSAEQEILDIQIADHVERSDIPRLTIDALNRAMKKAQLIAAEKMQSIMGDMGLGMPGMDAAA